MSAGMLEGKAAIVSGIGPGMGRAVALACAREGADVAIAARRPGRLDAVAAEIEALGRRALRVPTDIADPAQCRALAERTLAEFGRIDALHARAGDEVAGGQELVTIESMKNLVPVPSPHAGRVAAVHVEIDSFVDEGSPLLSVETA